jgi:outer membrane lipoprotein-sorting protein
MNAKTKATLGGSAAVATAGVVGLVLMTVPAGAGPAPSLPQVTPEALVKSVFEAKPSALHGTVQVQNQLGLPMLPQMPQLANGDSQAQVWTDGGGKARLSLPYNGGERTFVTNGKTAWYYNSSDRTATKFQASEHKGLGRGLGKDLAKGGRKEWRAEHDEMAAADPASASKEIISAIRQFSTVQVDGTAKVADRDAYQLVLTPKPSERTLLREVRVAVDSKLRMPLQMDVFTNGTPDPALRIGFSDLDVGKQDAARFEFTPPKGTTVTAPSEEKLRAEFQKHGGKARAEQQMKESAPRTVGEGWDTVVVAKLPKEMTQGKNGESNPTALLQQFGKPVSGKFGNGWVLTTKVGTALVTQDGRVAAGFVPQQVLTSTLAATK